MEEQNNTQDILNQVHESTPDTLHPLLDYIIKNGKMIVGGIAVIILLAGGISGVKYMNQQKMIKAQSEMGTILIKYSGAKQAEALAAFEKDAPASMKPAVQLALAKAWMDADRFADAKSVWADIAKTSPKLAPVAGLGQAKCLMLEDKAGEAITILQKIKESAGAAYAPSINRLLADAAEKAGNIQLAVQAYQGLLTSSPQEASFFEFKIKELKAKL
ncbi:tetratricopeptide repeat protein [Desulfovibrio sp. JC022]|uniref:tetratricopeptide repeat protein n=1 Tax=Desulfovibrio sp. JC022 TaxID=2593642 RepID=UPI0013D46F78|nr:tetratricopeptide repeat protein [Desulfovibrio sp. JC022]NDV23654.1 tetratricopeptide repeat protein [Desulfovibrio sp. JC022]